MSFAFDFPLNPPTFTDQPTHTRVLSRKVRDFLDTELKLNIQGDHFLLAVSGGADSLALLCLWHFLKPIYGHTFAVWHMNHMLREESTLEAKSIAALCAAWDIKCFVHQEPVADYAATHKLGLEEASRILRYTHLEACRKKCNAKWICLGHHLGDLQEDILMRLMRGSGWPALGGMQAVQWERHILRPLLLQNKQDFYSLLDAAKLGFVHDNSNDDTIFLRNKVRHELLPIIRCENPSFEQKAAELWQLASYDAEHWQGIIINLLQKYNIKFNTPIVQLPKDMLKNTDKATRLRLYMHTIKELIKNTNTHGQARAKTLLELDLAFEQGRGNTSFKLPGKVVAKLKNNSITFEVLVNNT